jgi:hypothetical protein
MSIFKKLFSGKDASQSIQPSSWRGEMSTDEDVLKPSGVEDFKVLPRWAVVAFTARCGRRIQPVFEKASAGANLDQIKIIDYAIALAEQAAAAGNTPAVDLSTIINELNKTMKIESFGEPIRHGRLPNTAYATMASWVAKSAVELLKNPPDLNHAGIAVANAQMASMYAVDAGDPIPKSIAILIRQDFEILVELTERHGWTDSSPVPPDVFGPLWPNGVPKGWEAKVTRDVGISYAIIPKADILQKSFSVLLSHIDSISLPQIRSGDRNYSRMVIAINGYDNDPRPLWDIPEVVEWFKELHTKHPYMPLFLTPGSVQLYFGVLQSVAHSIIPPEYRDKKDLVGLLLHTLMERNKYFAAALGSDYDRCQAILNAADKSVADAVTNLMKGIKEPV